MKEKLLGKCNLHGKWLLHIQICLAINFTLAYLQNTFVFLQWKSNLTRFVCVKKQVISRQCWMCFRTPTFRVSCAILHIVTWWWIGAACKSWRQIMHSALYLFHFQSVYPLLHCGKWFQFYSSVCQSIFAPEVE